jgi:hypothetical protein
MRRVKGRVLFAGKGETAFDLSGGESNERGVFV